VIRRQVVRTVAVVALVAVGVFGVLAPPERCPTVTVASLDEASNLTVDWFVDNQNSDGTWLYQYDAADDRVIDDYNIVRHAGAIMGLYQASEAGYDQALDSADAGLEWLLDRSFGGEGEDGEEWTAITWQGETSVGTVALLTAGLVDRRLATGDDVHDDLLRRLLVELLRGFHGRLARVVFAHDGTIDKYIGDAIMVHFGTPRPQKDDPVRALACAAAMIAEIGRWNAERERAGDAPIGIGIGVHYGEVLVGNIGDARRLEYTVLGDTVNVASRLERLTRETGTSLVVSDELVRAVHACGVEPSTLIEDLHRDQTRTVRGRREPVAIWCASPR
jgi:class 3 adenylate cyclase